MSKTEIYFNGSLFSKKIAELKTEVTEANRLQYFFKNITGKSVRLSCSVLDSFISSKTGFPNVIAGAELLGVGYEYNEITAKLPKLKHLDLFHFKDGVFTLEDETTAEMKEEFTTYLHPANEKHYKKIKKAVDILNEYPATIKRVLQGSVTDNYTINLHVLNTLDIK